MRTLLVVTTILIESSLASDVHAGGIKGVHGYEKSVVDVLLPQILSVLNRGGRWTPSEFAQCPTTTRNLDRSLRRSRASLQGA